MARRRWRWRPVGRLPRRLVFVVSPVDRLSRSMQVLGSRHLQSRRQLQLLPRCTAWWRHSHTEQQQPAVRRQQPLRRATAAVQPVGRQQRSHGRRCVGHRGSDAAIKPLPDSAELFLWHGQQWRQWCRQQQPFQLFQSAGCQSLLLFRFSAACSAAAIRHIGLRYLLLCDAQHRLQHLEQQQYVSIRHVLFRHRR